MCSYILSMKEWRFLRLPGHPVPVSDCSHCENLLPHIQGNLEAIFVCCNLSFSWALLRLYGILWWKDTLHCTLPLDPWRQQLDHQTYLPLLNGGQTHLPQLSLLHRMLQSLTHPCILVVFFWNCSSLLISSFYWKYCFTSASSYSVVVVLSILTLIPGV